MITDINPQVESALKSNAPIVALESTIVTHGMPYPQNLETALSVEAIVRKQVIKNVVTLSDIIEYKLKRSINLLYF